MPPGSPPIRLAIFLGAVACTPAQEAPGPDDSATRSDSVGDVITERESASDAAVEAELPETGDDAGPLAADPRVWAPQVIYLVMPDRFFNGDPSNDDLGSPRCFDPAAQRLFHGGDLVGLRKKLGYIESLGATAVWVTPLYVQVPRRGDACGYHGYWGDFDDPDPVAVEPKMGTLDDVDALISAAHAKGVRLVLDMVVNHPGRGAKIVARHPDWFHDPATCEELGDPTIYCPLNGLPDFAQEMPEVAKYLTAMSQTWVGRSAFDGIRMDTVKHVLPEYFRDSWVPGVRSKRRGLFLVGEIFDEGSYGLFGRYLDTGFDSLFNFPLRRALVETFAKARSVDLVAGRVSEAIAMFGIERARMLTSLLDNHDVPRWLEEPPTGLGDDELTRRYHLALTALFTLPGIPQLYYADELGAFGRDPENRRDMPAWAWDETGRKAVHDGYLAAPQGTFDFTRRLIELRKGNPALSSGSYSELWRQNGGDKPNVYAFYRAAGSNRVMVVLQNDDRDTGTLTMPFRTKKTIARADLEAWPDGTVLEDQLHEGAPNTVTVSSGTLSVRLGGKLAGIYRPR